MNIFESIRFLREKLHIPQSKMVKGMSNTTYSRLENGQRNLKFETLQEISTSLNMSINEILLFSEIDNEFLKFKREMEDCIQNITDLEKKNKFLATFMKKGNINNLTISELNHYLCIKAIFCTLWEDILPPTEKELDYICDYLVSKDFYCLVDYRLIVNTIIFFNDVQVEIIVKKMFPVAYYDRRPDILKSYARHTITNLISSYIYKLKYDKALNYVNFVESHFNLEADYYFRLVIAYHKNVALRFHERELSYFDEARDIVNIIAKISDPLTGKQFEEELNNLSLRADYYINITNYPRTIIKN